MVIVPSRRDRLPLIISREGFCFRPFREYDLPCQIQKPLIPVQLRHLLKVRYFVILAFAVRMVMLSSVLLRGKGFSLRHCHRGPA